VLLPPHPASGPLSVRGITRHNPMRVPVIERGVARFEKRASARPNARDRRGSLWSLLWIQTPEPSVRREGIRARHWRRLSSWRPFLPLFRGRDGRAGERLEPDVPCTALYGPLGRGSPRPLSDGDGG
jgi:hypothetical protein